MDFRLTMMSEICLSQSIKQAQRSHCDNDTWRQAFMRASEVSGEMMQDVLLLIGRPLIVVLFTALVTSW